MMNRRNRFLAACEQEPVDRPPAWLMRQAGRYLPEYRELKERYTFNELVKTPELATEVTLLPFRRFDFDAAIIFSDILVIPDALGQPYHFRKGGGIVMDFTLNNPNDIDSLDASDIPQKLAYVGQALTSVKNELQDNRALLGFGGSPWTLATYMLEGGSSKNFAKVKACAFQSPKAFEALMEKLTSALIAYFHMQIDAGVDALQIFDSWASICPGTHYWDLSLKWIKTIIDALPNDIPVILFAKGMSHHIPQLLETGANVLSLDWTVKLHQIRQQFPGNYALQGNLDPTLLNTTPQVVRQETETLLTQMESQPGYIFNLGHGILPQAKIENVETLIQTIHDYSPAYA